MSVNSDRHKPDKAECAQWREAIRARRMGAVEEGEPGALDEHLCRCPACRNYEAELNSMIAALRGMPDKSLEPRAELRKRWHEAILESLEGAAQRPRENLVDLLRTLLRNNWRPAAGLALIWIMIAGFKLDSPQASAVEIGKTGWTPVDVAQFFTSERQLMARRF